MVIMPSSKIYRVVNSGHVTVVCHMPDFNTFLPTEKQLKTPYLTNVRDSSGHNFLVPYNKNM